MSAGDKTVDLGVLHIDLENRIVVAEQRVKIEDAAGVRLTVKNENMMFSFDEFFKGIEPVATNLTARVMQATQERAAKAEAAKKAAELAKKAADDAKAASDAAAAAAIAAGNG